MALSGDLFIGPGRTFSPIPVSQTLDNDPVVHPSHYNHGKIEVLDIIDAFPHLNYNLLVALKYVLRAPYKNRQQDLRKAIHHLEHMIKLMDEGEPGYRTGGDCPNTCEPTEGCR